MDAIRLGFTTFSSSQLSIMATTSKQYLARGEDLWKGRAEKVVSCQIPVSHMFLSLVPIRMLNCSP